jgi:hypothetical protein
MSATGRRTGYKKWQKAALAGCLLVGLIGTLIVVGGLVKVTGTISDYGGTVGAPVILAFVMGILAMWLFAGSGALLVYVARKCSEIADRVGEPAADRSS